MNNVCIRSGLNADLAGIVEIYNHYIENSHCTFDIETISVTSRQPWLRQFGNVGRYRLFVATLDSRILGYATSSRFHNKAGYDSSVETTVYVDPDFTSQGIGRGLYESLFDALRDEDIHRAYAGVALPNPASIRLHEEFGFERVGIFAEVGIKFGQYRDVGWYWKSVNSEPGLNSVKAQP